MLMAFSNMKLSSWNSANFHNKGVFMGFSAGGFLTRIIQSVIDVVGLFKSKPSFSDIISKLVATLPAAILDGIAFGHIDSIQKLEEALQALDDFTGTESKALDIIRDLPQDKEEALFDAIKVICDILGKNKLKVEGYYVSA